MNESSHTNTHNDDAQQNISERISLFARIAIFARRHWDNYDIQATLWTTLYMSILLALVNLGIYAIEQKDCDNHLASSYQNAASTTNNESYQQEIEKGLQSILSPWENAADEHQDATFEIAYPLAPSYLPTATSIDNIPDSGSAPELFDISIYEQDASSSDTAIAEKQKMMRFSGHANSITINAFPDATNDTYEYAEENTNDDVVYANVENELLSEISDVEARGADVGFILLNLNTGTGIAYNIDAPIYSASTIKAPMSAYALQEYVETGECSLSSLSSLISAAITYSSNDAHMSLYNMFHDARYLNWLADNNIEYDIHSGAGSFARYSTRDVAKLWLNIYRYLSSGTETAQWFANQLSDTNLSFIRDSAFDTLTITKEPNENLMIAVAPTVYNKAGWYNDGGGRFSSTSDNAIIYSGDDVYLLCIMTSLPYSDANAARVKNISSTILSFAAQQRENVNSTEEQEYSAAFAITEFDGDDNEIVYVADSEFVELVRE